MHHAACMLIVTLEEQDLQRGLPMPVCISIAWNYIYFQHSTHNFEKGAWGFCLVAEYWWHGPVNVQQD